MEMPDQNMPVVFSQMLQMFPNIPKDIVWIYVQRYSSDIEKCAQMLNLQNGKYTGTNSPTSNNNEYLNEEDIIIEPSCELPSSKTVYDNNNEISLIDISADQMPLKTDEVSCSTNEYASNTKETEYLALNSQFLHSSPRDPSNILLENIAPVNNSSDVTTSNSSKFPETLALHINIDDDDGYVHNWRPNLYADVLGSDFFISSPMFENFPSNISYISNLNIQRDRPKVNIRPEGMNDQPFSYNATPIHIFPDYPLQSTKAYGIDIASYLNHQKSQMNAIRYEVIKAKIAISELKETEDRLLSELKEKMQSKSVQDIEKLNEEIVQLRLDCQCLCTEVDCSHNDPVLLGEVDEGYYESRSSSASTNTEIQNLASDPTVFSQSGGNQDTVEESQKWNCSQCTFANHPAINVCEVCHKPKPGTRNPPYLATPPPHCYCHPKEDSLFVQS